MSKQPKNNTWADAEVTDFEAIRLAGYIADATDFNATFPEPGTGDGLPDLAEVGETIRGKPVLPLGENVPGTVNWQIDSGRVQDVSDNVITFGFLSQKHATGLNNNPYYGEGRGYSEMTAAQKAAALVSINNWDELIAASFVQAPAQNGSSAWAQNAADIWLANTYTGPAQAWAYYPGSPDAGTRVSGDVWIADPRYNSSNNDLFAGGYGLQTLNHELGHSLGLSHPGDYNFGDDQDGDGVADPITYEGDAFYFQDSHQYTIMSYFDSFETGNDQIDWNLMRFIYPSTPMVHDIAVIQNKYGADMTTRTGDTTYGFNATADVTNPAMSFVENERLTLFSIWDAGGNDTLDLSGYDSNSVIDLRPGAYTSAGGPGEQLTIEEINANNAAAGLGSRTAAYDLYFGGREGANEGIPWSEIVDTDFVMDNNIGIAYGAIIENAIGGGGDDQINGNSANNELTGNGGDDTFVFADDSSTDTITDFDSGNDVIDLSELGADESDVTFGDHEIFVTTATNVVHIVSGNDQILMSDIYFG